MTESVGAQSLVDLAADPEKAMVRAVADLSAGRVVVIPTDTIYGIAAVAADAAAVASIFELKGRPADRRVAVLVADTSQAESLVVPSSTFATLAERFWPGPLTMVATRRPGVRVAAGDETTIGLRCPGDPFVRELARRVGPIATTSANLHGAEPPSLAASVASVFPMIATIIDGGPRSAPASTVVDVATGSAGVLRVGSVSAAMIDEALHGRQ